MAGYTEQWFSTVGSVRLEKLEELLRNDHSGNYHLRHRLTYISSPSPPCKDHQKYTQESKLFNVNDHHRVIYMFSIIWNVSGWLLLMSHSQRVKQKVIWFRDNWHTKEGRQMVFSKSVVSECKISIVNTFQCERGSVRIMKCSKRIEAFCISDQPVNLESRRDSQYVFPIVGFASLLFDVIA